MSKINSNTLLISSDFYSVQGEGISTGIPSYFVRLGLCNLNCGMSRAFTNTLLKEQSLADGEIFKGDLELEGKATWTCDSTSQWLWRGEEKDFQYLIDQWKEQDIYEHIRKGTIHIIWTGGEPTIKQHQEAIVNFFKYWDQIDPIKPGTYGKTPYNEIETNGTVVITDELFELLDQINCSPKLSNSGMTEKQRINPDAIKRIMEHSNYQFKFVISTEDDIKEMFRDFVVPFSIPLANVVCMPGLDSQTDFHERTQFVMEMAKKYKFRGMSRMHISAWDKTLNV
jgi:organic radical activating enzyme